MWGFPGGSAVKKPPAMHEPQETRVQFLGQEDTLEEGMATHPSILAWRIPKTEKPQATVHRVATSWTQLKRLSMHACKMVYVENPKRNQPKNSLELISNYRNILRYKVDIIMSTVLLHTSNEQSEFQNKRQ